MSKPAPEGVSRRTGLGLLAGALAAPSLGQAAARVPAWSTAWASTLQRQAEPPALTGRTVMVKVPLSVGGTSLRVRLSNEYGAKPLRVGAASVVVRGQVLPLSFSGSPTFVLPQAAPAVTDPVPVRCEALDVIEVRLFLPEEAQADSYQRGTAPKGLAISAPGDFTRQTAFTQASEGFLALVGAVEVGSDRRRPGLVIFGDTKSAGQGTWPDFLPALAGGRMAIANRSMYAGLLALAQSPDNGLARLDRDVLTVAGASHVLLFTGNNDLIQPGALGSSGRPMLDPRLTQTVEQLIDAQEQAATRIRAAGLRVIGGTWLPYADVAVEARSGPARTAHSRLRLGQSLHAVGGRLPADGPGRLGGAQPPVT